MLVSQFNGKGKNMNVVVICERRDLLNTDLRFKTVHVYNDDNLSLLQALIDVFAGFPSSNIVGVEAFETPHCIEVK